MACVRKFGILDTIGAIVPIWAVQALVANTIDELVAAITDSGVANVSARVAKEVSQGRESCLSGGGLEYVTGVVAVPVANMAMQAEIVVLTADASDELVLRQHLHTAVTGAGWLLLICSRWLLLGESTRNLLVVIGLDLGWDALGCAVDHATVLHEALDHPVALSRAVNSQTDTRWAEIIIAAVADAAVEVLIFHGVVAVVAIDDPRCADAARLGAEREASVKVGRRKVLEEFC